MPNIKMPDGTVVRFPDDMSAEQIRALIQQKYSETSASAAADDHGRERRSKMSAAEKLVSPITEYPRNYAELNQEAVDQMSRGAGQLASAVTGSGGLLERNWEGAKGAANLGLGALGYLGSPISAAYRSQFGNP